MAFDCETSSVNRMKTTFINNLLSWFNVYSIDRNNSLLEFLTWLSYRRGEGVYLSDGGWSFGFLFPFPFFVFWSAHI